MGELRDRMVEDMKLRGLSESTIVCYQRAGRALAAFHRRSPERMGEAEIREFLLHLVNERKVSSSTHYVYLAGIKFLYEQTLRRPEEVAHIPFPKVEKPLPDVPSTEEVERLFDAIKSLKHRAILMLAYGSGLRVTEACSLHVADIDSRRMLLHVRRGKGKKDRYAVLGDGVLALLREYWRRARPQGHFLFPGARPDAHITPLSVARALKKACEKSGLGKRVTPHSMRHGFATHQIEAGADIRTVQMLLGHSSIQTTARYISLSERHLRAAGSPIDRLSGSGLSPVR